MTEITIACYHPKPGKNEELKALVKDHVSILLKEQLVTDREPIIMEAKNGTIVEVFEWKSAEAIEEAHKNAAVLAMWQQFSEVCDYVAPATMEECMEIFSGFAPLE